MPKMHGTRRPLINLHCRRASISTPLLACGGILKSCEKLMLTVLFGSLHTYIVHVLICCLLTMDAVSNDHRRQQPLPTR